MALYFFTISVGIETFIEITMSYLDQLTSAGSIEKSACDLFESGVRKEK